MPTKSNIKNIISNLRVIIGSVAAFLGFLAITIIGALYSYGNNTVWIVGIAMIIVGALTSNSPNLIDFISKLS